MSGVRVPAPPPPTVRPGARLRRVEPVLRRALRGPCSLPRGGLVLVAASGGADSTALLLGLHRLRGEFGLALHAAHLNHGLRGVDADRDMDFVADLCARLGVRLAAARWNTRARMGRRGLSGQAGLRTLRREYLLAAARRVGACAIATGHTADDQAETMLLRILRGTGLAGFGAMSARSGPWMRPLLGASRDQIEADLKRAGQPWREDRSNLDLRYARGRVRHLAIPALLRVLEPGEALPLAATTGAPRAMEPGLPAREQILRGALARRVARLLGEARSARRWLERRAAMAVERASLPGSGPQASVLDCATLGSCPNVIRRQAVLRAWRSLDPPQGLTGRHLESIERLLGSPRDSGRVTLPGGWFAVREGARLRLAPRRPRVEGLLTAAPPGSGKAREGSAREPGLAERVALSRRGGEAAGLGVAGGRLLYAREPRRRG